MRLTEYIESILCDNLEYMASIPNNHFDWGICDPNYGIGASRPSRKPGKVRQKNGSILNAPVNNYTHKDWDDVPSPVKYFEEIKRVTKQQIIWGVNYYDYPLPGGRLLWDKLNGSTDQYDAEIAYLSFTNRVETVYYMWSGMIQGKKASSDIREAYKQKGDKRTNEKRIHPTQKPVQLYQWILNKWVAPGETVFDSHSGSLSLGIACHLHGCQFVGVEIDKEYFDLSASRVRKEFSREKMFTT